jgi:hypothetical protein
MIKRRKYPRMPLHHQLEGCILLDEYLTKMEKNPLFVVLDISIIKVILFLTPISREIDYFSTIIEYDIRNSNRKVRYQSKVVSLKMKRKKGGRKNCFY